MSLFLADDVSSSQESDVQPNVVRHAVIPVSLPSVTGSPVAAAPSAAVVQPHADSGASASSAAAVSAEESGSLGVWEGRHAVSEEEEQLLQRAAEQMVDASVAANARYRLRTKTQDRTLRYHDHLETPVKAKAKASYHDHLETPVKSAAKAKAARGTAGTFGGRRRPKDPTAAVKFEKCHVEYQALRSKVQGEKNAAKTPKAKLRKPTEKQAAYHAKLQAKSLTLKQSNPGMRPYRYIQAAVKELAQERAALSLHSVESL